MAEESFSKASSIRSITFDVDDVDIADNLLPENPCHQVMKDNFFPWRVESVSGQRKLLVGGNDYHQFVFTVHTAYADHRPLVISPGHIWLLICQGFALHVQENAETLRPLFVRFEGKKTLVVERPHFRKGAPDNPWAEVFPEFTRQIDSWLVDEMRDLLVPEFSTTTPVERAAFELTMMDAFESFFGYVTSLCGIPSITRAAEA